jgi:tRNA G37 N-methylase TrmD
MQFDIFTLIPEAVQAYLASSILGQARYAARSAFACTICATTRTTDTGRPTMSRMAAAAGW